MINAKWVRLIVFLGLTLGRPIGLPGSTPPPQAQSAATRPLPLKDGSVRFAVMGDTGRGQRGQLRGGAPVAAFHQEFPFDFVIMLGDNISGPTRPRTWRSKFGSLQGASRRRRPVPRESSATTTTRPSASTSFSTWAASATTPSAAPKASAGEPTVGGVRFFALDTDYLDKPQIDGSRKSWRRRLRVEDRLLPSPALFLRQDARLLARNPGHSRAAVRQVRRSVAFSGHDHFYERIKPQKGGIVYWVSGAAVRCARATRGHALTAKGFDLDSLHARRDQRRRHVFPGDQTRPRSTAGCFIARAPRRLARAQRPSQLPTRRGARGRAHQPHHPRRRSRGSAAHAATPVKETGPALPSGGPSALTRATWRRPPSQDLRHRT